MSLEELLDYYKPLTKHIVSHLENADIMALTGTSKRIYTAVRKWRRKLIVAIIDDLHRGIYLILNFRIANIQFNLYGLFTLISGKFHIKMTMDINMLYHYPQEKPRAILVGWPKYLRTLPAETPIDITINSQPISADFHIREEGQAVIAVSNTVNTNGVLMLKIKDFTIEVMPLFMPRL